VTIPKWINDIGVENNLNFHNYYKQLLKKD